MKDDVNLLSMEHIKNEYQTYFEYFVISLSNGYYGLTVETGDE